MRLAIVGGGPAGMTAALLLGRAGHRVTLFEAGAGLGGLWASQVDEDGYFLADNSCKVYQPGYRTAPALLRLIGTDPARHFVQRHDLTSDWLKPFIADSRVSDLGKLFGAFAGKATGLGALHEVSVEEYLAERGLSEACTDWMRATALGGIAGTLRMTVWELCHRLSSNLDALFVGASGPLHWNATPPNAPEGFLTPWIKALDEAGVEVRLGEPVQALEPFLHGVRVRSASHTEHAELALLALPPPALAGLLQASPPEVSRAFGRSPEELQALLAVSRYEHLGITWFFDRAFERDLPLGGHNVRRGWHPILVQHDQYGPHLRPPAVTAVVGSVALDTDFRHHRLGTMAREHSHQELAHLIWEEECRCDPALPPPIGFHIAGVTAATQITGAGPLPLRAEGVPLLLANNLHGKAPYFTASLEAAIQAGALAAVEADPAVERLDMPPPVKLPWTPSSTRRSLELRAELGCSAERAWELLLDTARWSQWSSFVRSLDGRLAPGARWRVHVQGPKEAGPTLLRPRLLAVGERRLLFASSLMGGLLRLEHEFCIDEVGPDRCILRQPLRASGALAALTWRRVEPTLRQFEAVGHDLAAYVARVPAFS